MKSRNSKPVAKYRVGDRVQFEWGWGRFRSKVWGTIVEDRGPIGINGRRLYYVDIPMDPDLPDEPNRTMMAEDELEPDTISRVPLKKSEIIDYLKKRLPGILLWNPSTELKDPVVWLGRDASGKITYTFSPRRGMIGGKLIPEFAYSRGRRIDARRKDEVAEFLLGFGLTPEEAKDVIQAVGVKPVKPPRRRRAGTA
jgi:hypothetical protein